MLPFDVILFDVGGVLLTNGWDHGERAAAVERFGLDRADFEARHDTVVDPWERSEIAAGEYLDTAVFYQPRSFSHQDFLDFIFSQSRLLPDGALQILSQLSASNGCMLGALNNEAREPNDYRFRTFGLRKHFKIALSSCYVGLRKPHPEIYRRALDILGTPPDRVLFIDDRPENAAGAADAGMKTIVYTGAQALRGQLNDLGVL
jgi:putative hydrolase of the HAD superfamily